MTISPLRHTHTRRRRRRRSRVSLAKRMRVVMYSRTYNCVRAVRIYSRAVQRQYNQFCIPRVGFALSRIYTYYTLYSLDTTYRARDSWDESFYPSVYACLRACGAFLFSFPIGIYSTSRHQRECKITLARLFTIFFYQ